MPVEEFYASAVVDRGRRRCVSTVDRVMDRLSAATASLRRADQAATVAVDLARDTADRAVQLGAERLADQLAALVDLCQRLPPMVLDAVESACQTTALAQAVRDGTGWNAANARPALHPQPAGRRRHPP